MRTLLLVAFILGVVGCKQNASKSDSEANNFEAFSKGFSEMVLPFSVSDTTIHSVAESAKIPMAKLNQYVPDSILKNWFGKDTSLKIQPVGKIEAPAKEDYLAVYIKGKSKAGIYMLVFLDNKFSAAMPLLETGKNKMLTSASIDKKLAIEIYNQWYDNQKLMYNKTIYAYNNVGVFTTVLTETNVTPIVTAKTVLNPIDTFPRKNKFSGDYIKGKKNFVSIRDGSSPGEYLFFIHFLNDGDDPCGGDLRGELKMVSDNEGMYRASGDPCVIDFQFGKNQVTVKEQGSCGNYRGIKCFFNDTYMKSRDNKSPAKQK